jgi:hypothetical protein
VFDDPVLKGVKADNNQPSTNLKPFPGGLKARSQAFEFAVYMYTQRLKYSRRRVDPLRIPPGWHDLTN